MIIRKPYAFLIRHFKKIHIFLLLLCAYIYYKTLQLSSFINEFMELGTYDSYLEPITKYIPGLVIISIILVIVLTAALILLLRHKGKPWKLYLLPIVEYAIMIVVFSMTKSFFNTYTGTTETTNIRMIHDLLFITNILQYPVFLLWLMRVFGVDLNKFNFQSDEEYLELESADREELEININIDKHSFKRTWKRLLRNMNYVYQEHKFICFGIIMICMVFLVFNGYRYFFVTNKTYKEGQELVANNFTIKINKSYYTDKDYTGNKISDKSSFVVVDLNIKNNIEPREVNLSQFHVMNGISNSTTTYEVYGTEFQDFGKTYEKLELKRDEEQNLILVFKVDKDLKPDKFVLYYQEFVEGLGMLRKIKVNIQNVSEIKTEKAKNLGEDLNFTLQGKKETISLDSYSISDMINYTHRTCSVNGCSNATEIYTAQTGYRVLSISFASGDFEGEDMIDFSTKYGKIKYIDSKGKTKVVEVKNTLTRDYYGKYLYLKVPEDMEDATSINMEYIVRNKKYVYKLR